MKQLLLLLALTCSINFGFSQEDTELYLKDEEEIREKYFDVLLIIGVI